VAPIALVTDSTSVIPADLVAKYGIFVGPQVVIWDGKTLEDGVDLMPDAFYARLKTRPRCRRHRVTVVLSENLQAARPGGPADCGGPGLDEAIGDDPVRGTRQEGFSGAQIEIVDLMQAGMALGFQVLMTARQIEAGRSFTEVGPRPQLRRRTTGTMLVADTLEFLHRVTYRRRPAPARDGLNMRSPSLHRRRPG
jgi:hypothetical protein